MAKSNPKDKLPYKETGIPVGIVKRDANLAPIKKKLDKQYGEGNWGLDEVAANIQERNRRKSGEKPKEKKKEIKEETEDSTPEEFSVEDETERRYQEYLKEFPDTTSNDRVGLRQLAVIEAQMREIANWRNDPKKVSTVRELKDLGTLERDLSAEHRQIQESLGIGRVQREGSGDAEDERLRMIEGTNEFLEKEVIHIRCPHCGHERNLNQGFIVFHFREHVPWVWQSKCPNCGQEIEIRSML